MLGTKWCIIDVNLWITDLFTAFCGVALSIDFCQIICFDIVNMKSLGYWCLSSKRTHKDMLLTHITIYYFEGKNKTK